MVSSASWEVTNENIAVNGRHGAALPHVAKRELGSMAMAKHTVECPQCGASYKIDETKLGKKGRCSKCGNSFILASASTVQSATAPPRPKRKSFLDEAKERSDTAAQQPPRRKTRGQDSMRRCTVETTCGKCGTILAVPDDRVGKKGRCPKCNAVFLIPEIDGQTQATAPAAVEVPHSNGLVLTGTVTEVCAAYRDMNPLVAEKRCRGKTATVTGQILSLMPLSNTVLVVLKCLLQEGGDLGCIFGAEQRMSLEKTSKGQTVTIKGTMKPAGDHFGLEGCVLLSADGQMQPTVPGAVGNHNSNELILTGTATEVYAAYRDMNPLVAERLYRGRTATVTGEILSLMEVGNYFLVTLESLPPKGPYLICRFGEEQRTSLEKLSKGQTATVRGTMKTSGDSLQLEESFLL